MIAEWQPCAIQVSRVVERASDIDGYEMRVIMTLPGGRPIYFAACWRHDEPEPDMWKLMDECLHEALSVSEQHHRMLMKYGKFDWDKAVS